MKLVPTLAVFVLVLFTQSTIAQLTIKITKIPLSTPANTTIYIAGDFNNWEPANEKHALIKKADGSYLAKISTGKEQINYKFTLGSWDKVECNAQGKEISNRVAKSNKSDTVYAKIEAWKTGIKKSTRASNVHIIAEDFYMPQFNRKRKIWIYLPPNYHQTQKKYPVLYMHDGQNLFDDTTSYAGEWGIDESLNKLFKETGKGYIVVGINHGDSLRGKELTPWVNILYGGGKGPVYVKFIVETLKPFIDKNYRTLPDRENTGVMGSSFGGINSFYTGLAYHNIFSKIGAFSPSFWYSDECYKMAEEFNKSASIKMYMLAGGNEYQGFEEQAKKMEQIFRKKGYSDKELLFKFVEEGTHSETFWRKEFLEAFKWLFLEANKRAMH